MKHPFWNRVQGWIFFGMIAFFYPIIVLPIQLWLHIRSRQRDMAWIGHRWFHVQLRLLGIMPTVEGEENIPKGSSFMVLSNHQSFMDIGTLMTSICPLAFLAKRELFNIPFFGNSLKFMGCIPIDRKSRTANTELPNLLRTRIRDGYNYCVYPEGTRSPDGALLPFKNGIFKIIKEAPVPVLPVTLIDTGKALPKKGPALYRLRPHMVIHPVITPEQIEQMTYDQFRDQVRNTIESGLSKRP